MSELSQVVSRIRGRLQDTDRSNYVWSTPLLEDFAGEAVRRLGPVVGVRKRVEVTVAGGEPYTITHRMTIAGSDTGPYAAGKQYNVKVDPEDRTNLTFAG